MRPRIVLRAVLTGGFVIGTIYAVHDQQQQQPQPFREYPGVEYERFPLPRDIGRRPSGSSRA